MTEKVFVKFIRPNGMHQPGDLAALDEEYAEKLASADPPRVRFPAADEPDVAEAIERRKRRSAVRLRKQAAARAKEVKQLEVGEKFLKENPDVDVKPKARSTKKDGEKKASRRNKPIKVEE